MSKRVIDIKDVAFSYPGGVQALKGATLGIDAGEKVALLGLNGSGKSTLMLLIDGLLTADSGEVTVCDTKITATTAVTVRGHVGFVFQNSDDQLFMPTVEADVAFGPRNMGLSDDEVERRVAEALALTGCSHLRHRTPFQLSGGQKRMVSLATVLAMEPEILVLDEPTSGLDWEARAQFVKIILSLPHTLLMSTHDPDLATTLCRRAVVMDEGRVTWDGPISDSPFPPKDFSC